MAAQLRPALQAAPAPLEQPGAGWKPHPDPSSDLHFRWSHLGSAEKLGTIHGPETFGVVCGSWSPPILRGSQHLLLSLFLAHLPLEASLSP